jgi:type 1 fimbria pilin
VAIVAVSTNGDGNQTLTAYKGSALPATRYHGRYDDGTGSYTFTLVLSTCGQGQNDLSLTFDLAVDADGDAASSSFTADIRDAFRWSRGRCRRNG